MVTMESIRRRARQLALFGEPPDYLMPYLVVNDQLDEDAAELYEIPTDSHWAACQRFIEERFRR